MALKSLALRMVSKSCGGFAIHALAESLFSAAVGCTVPTRKVREERCTAFPGDSQYPDRPDKIPATDFGEAQMCPPRVAAFPGRLCVALPMRTALRLPWLADP